MDEITLFAELKPPPPENAADLRAGARSRLDTLLNEGPATGSGTPAGAGPDHGVRLSHRHRRQGRLVAAAAAVAVAAGAAALTTTLLPSGPGSHAQPGQSQSQPAPSPSRADWVVQRQPKGDFTVTVHEMRDPAGLQRALRARGIPAYVFTVPYEVVTIPTMNHGKHVTNTEVRPISNCETRPWRPLPKGEWKRAAEAASEPYHVPGGWAFDVNPAGIPHGASLTISVGVWTGPTAHGTHQNEITSVGTGVGYGPIGECLPNR